jgi:hypothetical protein
MNLNDIIRDVERLIHAIMLDVLTHNGKPTGLLDSRLDFYGKNQQSIPSISGDIIPEFVHSEAQYHADVLNPMYRDIEAQDREKVLQYEWLNSRAAIPKFGHKAIEIRILDTQECAQADIAIALLIQAVLRQWYDEGLHRSTDLVNPSSQAILAKILHQGNVSERILRAYRKDAHQENLVSIYRQLGDCLLKNQLFEPS